ncbi:MAG: metallophosphoesterase [Clostridia bacterium]|nr:metallophosphoesterase [Clostridia bacterium]
MKKKLVAVICLVAMLLTSVAASVIPASAADSDWIDRDPVDNVDYSFAVLGDIQTITYSDTKLGTKYLSNTITWLLDNKESRNIQYVFGLGDTVETLTTYPESFRNPLEWDVASAQFNRLNGTINYSVVRGNHDDEAGYHEHICTKEYKSQMDGFFFDPSKPVTLGNSMSNSYRKIEIGNHKYLMLNLDFRATPEVINWANDVIYKNYQYKVIVSIHAYLDSKGALYQDKIGSSNVDDTVLEWLSFDGEYLWDNLFSRHDNVFMVLCGHVGITDPIIQTRTGNDGNEVIEILVDPQSYDKKDPSGFLLMLNFTEGGSKIEFEYFSPTKGKYFKSKNQISMTLPDGLLPEYVSTPVSVETEGTTEPLTTESVDTAEDTAGASVEKKENPYVSVIGISLVLSVVVVAVIVCLIIMRSKKKE